MKKLLLLICLFALLVSGASAQSVKWDTVRYDKWGLAVQLPAGASKQDVAAPLPAESIRDVYSANGLAFVIQITPTADTALASTVIEQAIQSEMKAAAKLGEAKRWEQNSKQGDLYKGFLGPVALKKDDAVQAVVDGVIGGENGVQCVSMASLGDETAPVLRISVYGPADRASDVEVTGKGIAAFAKRSKVKPAAAPPKPVPIPRPTPTPHPKPRPAPKPWPMLKKGEIELSGVIDSISKDGKIVMMTVDTVKVVGQDTITLSPVRSKKVLLRTKLDWAAQGLYIHLIGKNTGMGAPIPADAIEQAPIPAPKPAPLRPLPLSKAVAAQG